MSSVILDIDGVIADFEGAFCNKFGWEYREFVKLEYRYPDRAEQINWFAASPQTYERLDIIETGIKIARFCENEGYDIRVISSRPMHMTRLTAEWLKLNRVPFSSLSLENGSKMGRIERVNPLFVVDDLLEVCEQCAELGIPSFLIDHPWNQKEDLDGIIYRIESFDEFLGAFTNYFDI